MNKKVRLLIILLFSIFLITLSFKVVIARCLGDNAQYPCDDLSQGTCTKPPAWGCCIWDNGCKPRACANIGPGGCAMCGCGPACPTDCPGGTKRCKDTIYIQQCQDLNEDGCWDWETIQTCETGYKCQTGTYQCVVDPGTCECLGCKAGQCLILDGIDNCNHEEGYYPVCSDTCAGAPLCMDDFVDVGCDCYKEPECSDYRNCIIHSSDDWLSGQCFGCDNGECWYADRGTPCAVYYAHIAGCITPPCPSPPPPKYGQCNGDDRCYCWAGMSCREDSNCDICDDIYSPTDYNCDSEGKCTSQYEVYRKGIIYGDDITDASDTALCPHEDDCVDDGICIDYQSCHDVDDDGDVEYCGKYFLDPEATEHGTNGWWMEVDTFGQGLHAINPDYPEYPDDYSGACDYCVASERWNIGGDYVGTYCCGDDSGENYEYKYGIRYEEGGDGQLDDTSDDACCDSSSDCVHDVTCYSVGTCSDADGDGDAEYCGSSSRWFEVDSYGIGGGLEGYPNHINADDLCTACVGSGRWNLGGDAVSPKDAPNGYDHCCGDDSGEYYRTGPDGTAACCDTANECVIDGECMDYGDATETTCDDGIDNDCDGDTDAEDSDCPCDFSQTVCEEDFCNGAWDATGQCCDAISDDTDRPDCGRPANTYICDAVHDNSQWLNAYPSDFVKYLECSNSTWLYDGTTWHNSTGICDIKSVGAAPYPHEFLDVLYIETTYNPSLGLISEDKHYWAECAGDELAYNNEDTGGQSNITGESVSCNGDIYYCASDETWTTDLDGKDLNTCEAAKIYGDDAGFVWIGPTPAEGDFCCGDDDTGVDDGDDVLTDCGLTDGSWICDPTATAPELPDKDASVGDAIKLDCDNTTYLFDGTNNWPDATGGCTTETVNGHQFLDINISHVIDRDTNYTWAECAGNDPQHLNNEDTGGKNFVTGGGVSCNDDIYFCTSDKTWITDLDQTDRDTCEAAVIDDTDLVWIGPSPATEGGFCCGDDVTDCNQTYGSHICDPTDLVWPDENAYDPTDLVKSLRCEDKEYLFNNTNWTESEGTCENITVDGHQFLDVEKPTSDPGPKIPYYWAECAANGDYYNTESTGGQNFLMGDDVSCNDITYYCAYDNKWYGDLDETNKETCEAAGFVWIGPSAADGGFCCGDDGFDDCKEAAHGNLICDATDTEYKAINASADPIIKLDCDNKEYLIFNDRRYESTGVCTIMSVNLGVNDHEFLDVDDTFSYWAECPGEDDAYNTESTGGQNFLIGDDVSCGETTYYCANNSKWYDDLDATNENTCNAAGFTWIGPTPAAAGGFCCGDDGFYDTFPYYQSEGDACFRGEVLRHCLDTRTINKISYDFISVGNKIGFGVENALSGFDDLVITDEVYGNILYKNNFSDPTQIQDFQQINSRWYIQTGEYVGFPYTDFGISLIPYDITGGVIEFNGVIEFTLNTKPTDSILTKKNGLIIFGFVNINNFLYGAVRPNLNQIELGRISTGNKNILVSETLDLPDENIRVRVTIEDGYVTLLVRLEDGTGEIINEHGYLYDCSNNGEYYCDPIVCNNYFCSYGTNNWEPYYGEPRNKARTWPGTLPENGIPTECCEQSQCWNGTACINDQFNDPKSKPHENYRCLNGEWRETALTYTWDYTEDGYCHETSQCLVNPYSTNTNFENLESIDIDTPSNNDIQCINDQQYIGDHYCENGNWTTRTKLIALQLLDTTKNSDDPNDYVLFCDDYEATLNYYNYEIATSYGTHTAYDYIIKQNERCKLLGNPVPCVNKFCILKYKKSADKYGVAIGASLNNEINQPDSYSILELFAKDINYCNYAMAEDGQFHSCKPLKDTWYNNKINSIIYSKDRIDLREITFWNEFLDFLKNPFNSIFDTILNVIKPAFPEGGEFDYSFIEKTKDFNRLYISRKDTKSIRGITEKISRDELFLSVAYEGFNVDICKSIDTYWNKTPAFGVISCNVSDNIYYVETQALKRMDIWKDLTSILRVK